MSVLRFFVGLALCTVFEKFLPRNGLWGPQAWFIEDTANMGFPFPAFFAWVAVLSEFFGGILLMLGLFTRPAALVNIFVTFTATFLYHKGDIGDSGLLSFFFLLMCTCIFLFGPGKYSLDALINKRIGKKWLASSALVLCLISLNGTVSFAKSQAIADQKESQLSDVSKVQFYLKNNSIFPKKITFIIYQPQEVGNNTRVRWFLPFQKVKFELPVQSKIYLATNKQIDTVMQGQRIDDDKPFVCVDVQMKQAVLPLHGRE